MAKPPSQLGKSLPKPGRRLATRQVLDMQQAMYKTALLLEKDALGCTDGEARARVASALANLAKGWDALENRKRILRGRPLPGSLRPEKPRPKVGGYSSFIEPLGPGDEPVPVPCSPAWPAPARADIETPAQPALTAADAALGQVTVLPQHTQLVRPPLKPPVELQPPPTVCYPDPSLWQKPMPTTRTEAAAQRAQALLNHQAIQRQRLRQGLA
jgi:hypothetical protein